MVNDFDDKRFPVQSTIHIVICDRTRGGKDKCKFLVVQDGELHDATHRIARLLKIGPRKYDEKTVVCDPELIVANLGIALYNDPKSLIAKRVV